MSQARPPLNWVLVIQRAAVFGLVAALGLYALWPQLPWGRNRTRTLVLYGFSILGEVMNEGIFPAFQARWQDRTGERVEFISSFASSGTITNQIILGVPAQVAILSLELDALRLVSSRVVTGPTWRALPHEGVVNRTPFIIMVRPGNPRRITDFDSLGTPGIGIVHPDPLTSGGAQWAILAEYGAALRGRDREAAYEQLLGIWRNVVAQASSARAARTQFENGFGDALITYEQEGVRDRARGRLKADLVYPRSTILSDHTVVVIEKNIRPEERELVRSFVGFLWSEAGQQIFVDYGFRSVIDRLNAGNRSFGAIKDPFTVGDLGGWPRAKAEVIEAIWKARVLQEVGR
ncbi:MAG TPA: substrate-binding domain-containing protein [bacterium]|jgi:sulfate transport system substrate-binding protein|nr:substrate-binding domain-containing protein [bacterium]